MPLSNGITISTIVARLPGASVPAAKLAELTTPLMAGGARLDQIGNPLKGDALKSLFITMDRSPECARGFNVVCNGEIGWDAPS
jgi:hypothetical protein